MVNQLEMSHNSRQLLTGDTSEAEIHEPDVWRPYTQNESERRNQSTRNGNLSTSKLVSQCTRDGTCTSPNKASQ